MPKSSNQKQRILLLRRFLEQRTDEEHPVTLQEMTDYLEQNGVAAERKTLYDDLETLRAFGVDVLHVRTKGKSAYCVGERAFQLPELRLLVDAVQSSRFITRRKSMELIGKIEGLTSAHQAKLLHRQVFVHNRIKTMNESIYYNVDDVQTAIVSDRVVSFRYFDYGLDKQRVFRRDGQRYVVSPFALTWDNENYYMIGYDASTASVRHFRVDKMADIRIEEQTRSGKDVLGSVDLSEYTERHFDMFRGERRRVRLRVENRLTGAIIDRFGKDVSLIPDGEGFFTVTVEVSVSPRFFGWVCGFGESMRIVWPEDVTQQMGDFVRSILQMYGGQP